MKTNKGMKTWGLKDARNILTDKQYKEFSYSDYGGDFYDVVNIRYIKENYKYGRDYISFDTHYNGEILFMLYNQHTKDELYSLADYPIFDDELYSELTCEQIADALEVARYDNSLRDTENVNSALTTALMECGTHLATSLDYSNECVLDVFKSIYNKGY